MCLRCSGLGRVITPDVDAFLDRDRSLEAGAILLPGFKDTQWFYRQYADTGMFDPATRCATGRSWRSRPCCTAARPPGG